MKLSDVMGAAGLVTWAEIGLVISLVTFAAIAVWLVAGRRSRWDRVARLPLEDDAGAGPSAEHGGSR